MNVAFISKRSEYAHSTPVMERMFELLRKRGVEVGLIVPERDLIDLGSLEVNYDLYLLRPGVELGLSIAGILHRKGARILNDYVACTIVQDKAQVAHDLLVHGIPTARSFITGHPAQVMEYLDSHPVIIKPHRGSYGHGVHVLDHQDVDSHGTYSGVFVQQYKRPFDDDLKVYVIGKHVTAIRRKFPAQNYDDKIGRPVMIDEATREIALKVGEIFNLDIYGLDIIETDEGPLVIDVNYFPGFIGVPNAPEMLANFICDYVSKWENSSSQYAAI